MRTSWLAVRADRAIHKADGSNPSQLYRSQFPSPVLFLGYNGRDNVDMQPCDLLSTLPSTKSGRNIAMSSAMPRSFQAQVQFNYFFFFFNSNSSPLMTSSFAVSKLLLNFPRRRSWLEQIFLYLQLFLHSHYNIASMERGPCCQGNQEECISSASVGFSILIDQMPAVFLTYPNSVDIRRQNIS